MQQQRSKRFLPVVWVYIGIIVLISLILGVFSTLYANRANAAEATAAPPTVEIYWEMPAGASDTNVLWDQLYIADPTLLKCDTWYQVDTYLSSEAAKFYADGILTLGEDYSSKTQTGAIQWRFVYGGLCPPVVVPPVVVPPVVIVPPVVEPPAVIPPVTPPAAPVSPEQPILVLEVPKLAATGSDEPPYWLYGVSFILFVVGGLLVLFGHRRK